MFPVELDPKQAAQRVQSGILDIAIVKSWGSRGRPKADNALRRDILGIDQVDIIVPNTHSLANRTHTSFRQLTGLS